MYVRCPDCETDYSIDAGQLRAGRGKVWCERCHSAFQAVPFPANTDDDPPSGDPPREPSSPLSPRFWQERLEDQDAAEARAWVERFAAQPRRRKERTPPSAAETLFWEGGVFLLAVLLLVQIFDAAGESLKHNAQVRVLLDDICGTAGCNLSPFRDLNGFKILDRRLNKVGNGKNVLEFSLSFANQSDLPQHFPRLTLRLNELDGRPVAERIFEPAEYLPEWREDMTMPTDRPFEIHLSLVKPGREIGDFAIEFQ